MSTAAKGLLAAAVVALIGLAVCSYQQAREATIAPPPRAASADGTPINACALLKDDEVSQVVDTKVSEGRRNDDGEIGGKDGYTPLGTYSSNCIWEFAATDTLDPSLHTGGKRFVILTAISWPKNEDAAFFLQSFREASKGDLIPSEPVPLTIGDEALWWGYGTAARKGKISISMSVFLQNADKPAQRQMEEVLARKVIPRI